MSNIAAVIAVTILHREGKSPEERLLEIIDASGEAEVLDIADVLTENEAHCLPQKPSFRAANDNGITPLC